MTFSSHYTYKPHNTNMEARKVKEIMLWIYVLLRLPDQQITVRTTRLNGDEQIEEITSYKMHDLSKLPCFENAETISQITAEDGSSVEDCVRNKTDAVCKEIDDLMVPWVRKLKSIPGVVTGQAAGLKSPRRGGHCVMVHSGSHCNIWPNGKEYESFEAPEFSMKSINDQQHGRLDWELYFPIQAVSCKDLFPGDDGIAALLSLLKYHIFVEVYELCEDASGEWMHRKVMRPDDCQCPAKLPQEI